MSDLSSLRKRIDDLDNTLVELLNERAQVSLNIGAAKRKATDRWMRTRMVGYSFCVALTLQHTFSDTKELHVYMPGREKEVYAKVKHMG